MSDVRLVADAEAVRHPQHYGGDKPYEAIKVMEAWGEAWADEGAPPKAVISLTQVLKYLRRHRSKGNPVQDLQKARWYLDRVINGMESAVAPKPKRVEWVCGCGNRIKAPAAFGAVTKCNACNGKAFRKESE